MTSVTPFLAVCWFLCRARHRTTGSRTSQNHEGMGSAVAWSLPTGAVTPLKGGESYTREEGHGPHAQKKNSLKIAQLTQIGRIAAAAGHLTRRAHGTLAADDQRQGEGSSVRGRTDFDEPAAVRSTKRSGNSPFVRMTPRRFASSTIVLKLWPSRCAFGKNWLSTHIIDQNTSTHVHARPGHKWSSGHR